MRIVKNSKVDWKLAKKLFDLLAERHKVRNSKHIKECHHQLDAMLKNAGKRADLENTVFREDSFDFDAMIRKVKSMYSFSPL
ncbi:MAG: hypothetical protein ACRD5H_14095 [Nitrososphaerales archaeon]